LNRFEVTEESELYGRALEHLIFSELKAYLSYRQSGEELTYWRTLSKLEVDFVVGDRAAIEVKASKRVSARDEKGLRALAEEIKLKNRIIVCNESQPRISDTGVAILPVEYFLQQLWSGGII